MSKTYQILPTCIFCVALIAPMAYADEYTDLVEYRNSLREQIEHIDSEIARCEKSAKKWKTATILGGIGTVATGVGVVVQVNQISDNKKALNTLSEYHDKMDEATK